MKAEKENRDRAGVALPEPLLDPRAESLAEFTEVYRDLFGEVCDGCSANEDDWKRLNDVLNRLLSKAEMVRREDPRPALELLALDGAVTAVAAEAVVAGQGKRLRQWLNGLCEESDVQEGQTGNGAREKASRPPR